jgi:hypothetical protein
MSNLSGNLLTVRYHAQTVANASLVGFWMEGKDEQACNYQLKEIVEAFDKIQGPIAEIKAFLAFGEAFSCSGDDS